MVPFRKVFRRRGMRRVLVPFTLALAFLAVSVFTTIG